MNDAVSATLAIVGGVISLAIISVLVSRQAQTPQVLGAAGSALSGVIGAAVSPVTGSGAGGGGFGGIGGGGGFNLGNIGGDITSLSNIASMFGG